MIVLLRWKATDIIFKILYKRELHNNLIVKTNKKPNVNFIRRHVKLLDIKDHIHIIENGQRLDNTDVERINTCFLVIIIDYGNNYNNHYRNIISRHDERVIPEMLKLYNHESNEYFSVFHKNICYVSTNRVLHHKSWINISDKK